MGGWCGMCVMCVCVCVCGLVAVVVVLLFSSPLSVCISVSSLSHFLSLPSHTDLVVLILFRHLGFFLFFFYFPYLVYRLIIYVRRWPEVRITLLWMTC